MSERETGVAEGLPGRRGHTQDPGLSAAISENVVLSVHKEDSACLRLQSASSAQSATTAAPKHRQRVSLVESHLILKEY